MNAKGLNQNKAFLSLGIMTLLVLLTISIKAGNGFLFSLVYSLIVSIPITWVAGLILRGAHEILIKPIRDWLYR